MEDVDIKSLFKNVVRQIHPDLFAAYPFERARNSESLKVRPFGPVTRIEIRGLFSEFLLAAETECVH